MKKSDVTVEQFAKWSFERDVARKLEYGTWDNADDETQEDYLDEAGFYFTGSMADNWPLDILNRLDKE